LKFHAIFLSSSPEIIILESVVSISKYPTFNSVFLQKSVRAAACVHGEEAEVELGGGGGEGGRNGEVQGCRILAAVYIALWLLVHGETVLTA
jgi:hypothetical protein